MTLMAFQRIQVRECCVVHVVNIYTFICNCYGMYIVMFMFFLNHDLFSPLFFDRVNCLADEVVLAH